MEPVRSIARLGFRKWYERRLIEGHAWLVAALLGAICVGLSVEGLTFHEGPLTSLADALVAFVGGLFVWHALRRFLAILVEAQRLSGQSVCPACSTYARFEVINPLPRMGVRCRKCGHQWTIAAGA